jgi:hypothetical protein
LITDLNNKKSEHERNPLIVQVIDLLILGLLNGELMPHVVQTRQFQGFYNSLGDNSGLGGKKPKRKSNRKSNRKLKRRSNRKLH